MRVCGSVGWLLCHMVPCYALALSFVLTSVSRPLDGSVNRCTSLPRAPMSGDGDCCTRVWGLCVRATLSWIATAPRTMCVLDEPPCGAGCNRACVDISVMRFITSTCRRVGSHSTSRLHASAMGRVYFELWPPAVSIHTYAHGICLSCYAQYSVCHPHQHFQVHSRRLHRIHHCYHRYCRRHRRWHCHYQHRH